MKKREIEVIYCPSTEIVEDALTKPLIPHKFQTPMNLMPIRDVTKHAKQKDEKKSLRNFLLDIYLSFSEPYSLRRSVRGKLNSHREQI